VVIPATLASSLRDALSLRVVRILALPCTQQLPEIEQYLLVTLSISVLNIRGCAFWVNIGLSAIFANGGHFNNGKPDQ
jgi:hypothetical protein